MNRAIEWFARNRVAANLLMILIFVAGGVSIWNSEQEVFPEFSLDMLTITVPYLGAAPEEVEEAVCVRIEEAIQGLDGIKRIRSTAAEGIGTVIVELELGSDSREVLDDVKNRVDAIDTFPEETEKPIITEVTNRTQVINVAVWGEADETSLKHVAEQVRDEISAIPGITVVDLASARPYEISIEVSEDDLRRHGLSFDQVAGAVRRSSIELPGGSVKTAGGEILLRTSGQAERGTEFEDLVLLTRPDGTHVRLGDVATVVDGFEETDQFTRFEGKPAMIIQVYRVGDQSALDISTKVKEYVAAAQPRMPEGISLTPNTDYSKVLRDRLNLLIKNGLYGFALVFAVLALFLRFRLAFWVSLGIPISFAGAMWLMPGLDVSVNLISLFAFIVVLGIVVDDAIIVGENIFTEQQGGKTGVLGAIRGAQRVSVPVVFAVLTTVAAFSPLLAIEGAIGKIMRTVPLIVIPCLLFSLVESLWILPAHLSHQKKRDASKAPGAWRRFQGKFSGGLEWFIDRAYKPSLETGLRWRYVTVALGTATLVITLGMWFGGWIKFTFFPEVEADYMSAALTMPQGTPVGMTSDGVERIEKAAEQLRREVLDETGEDPFRYVMASIGEMPYREQQNRNAASTAAGGQSDSHLGEVTIELTPAEDRDVSAVDLVDRWRELAGVIPDAVEQQFTASLFNPGEDINVQLTGPNLDSLTAAADAIKGRLGEYAGVYEITDSFREGKREIQLDIKPAAEVLGLTLADLGRQVRQAFYGEEAQRIVRGREDIRVMVRFPEDERRSVGDLENMRIRTPDGREIPFLEVAEVRPGRGYSTIQRVDRRRAVNVTASVDDTRANAGEIIADLRERVLPEVLLDYPGVLSTFEGQQAEQRDTLGGLKRGFLIALIAIYALLAVPLRSYLQPVVIMSAIPFGLVGAIWGHLILGLNLTILSMFGIVALAGVVVNDSLVMVDFINVHRKEGGTLLAAVRQAGIVRFRPILLTSMTTFVGLFPLLMEQSMQAQFLIPMAASLAFGVVFSTFITLVLVPSGYMILEDLRKIGSKFIPRLRDEGEDRYATPDEPAAAAREALPEPSRSPLEGRPVEG